MVPVPDNIRNLPRTFTHFERLAVEDRASAVGAANGSYERLVELQADHRATLAEVRRLEAAFPKAEERRITTASEKATELSRQIARLRDRYNTDHDKADDAKQLSDKLTTFVAELGHSRIREVTPKVPKGTTIETIREELSGLAMEAARIAAAPLPAADLRQLANLHVDQIAATGEPTIWHQTDATPVKLDRIGPETLIWLFAEAIKTKIAGHIGDDQPGAMPVDQRERNLADLNRRKIGLERIEEALIAQAEAEGRIVARRLDADPMAIIGIEIVGGR